MSAIKIEVQGDRALVRTLSILPRDIRESADVALDLISEKMVAYAKTIAPARTGRLRRSIYHKRRGQMTHEVGAQVFYSIFVEYGTRKMKAKAFLRPAYYRYVGEIHRTLIRKIQEGLQRRGE